MAYDGVDWKLSRPIFPSEYHPYAPFVPTLFSKALLTAYVCARRSSRLLIATHYPRNLQTPATDRDFPDRVNSSSFVALCDGYRYIPDHLTHVAASVVVGIQPSQRCTLSARVKVQREVLSTAWSRTSNVLTITVPSGHGFVPGDVITFDSATLDVTTPTVIESTTATTVGIANVAANASATEAGVVATTDTGDAVSTPLEPASDGVAPEESSDPLVALANAQIALASARFMPFEDQTLGCWVALDNCPAGLTHRIQIEVKVIDSAGNAMPWRPYYGTAWGEIRDE